MTLVTESLYMGAFALTNGAELKRIVVSRTNGRRTAVFELDCPWVQKLADEYLGGTAVVNVAEYRQRLEELKDALFEALKNSETETQRRPHAAHRQGRDRGPQAPR